MKGRTHVCPYIVFCVIIITYHHCPIKKTNKKQEKKKKTKEKGLGVKGYEA